jgi:hypothetical protein
LDATAKALVDTEALARLLLRAESVASSYIEGLVVDGRRLLPAEAALAAGAAGIGRDGRGGARQHPGHDLSRGRARDAEAATLDGPLSVHERLL